MYLIQVDHLTYTKRDGSLFSLVEAARELAGCGNARILRADGTRVLDHAGDRIRRTHAPTGRTLTGRRYLRTVAGAR